MTKIQGKCSLYRQLIGPSHSVLSFESLTNFNFCSDFVLGHFIVRAREAELKRMDKDKELPVVVRLCCGGLAGGISQTGRSCFPQTVKWSIFYFKLVSQVFSKLVNLVFVKLVSQVFLKLLSGVFFQTGKSGI